MSRASHMADMWRKRQEAAVPGSSPKLQRRLRLHSKHRLDEWVVFHRFDVNRGFVCLDTQARLRKLTTVTSLPRKRSDGSSSRMKPFLGTKHSLPDLQQWATSSLVRSSDEIRDVDLLPRWDSGLR